MTCSPARRAANIANAARSSGPKSAEGKERSRGNALKHGFCAEVVRSPEDTGAIEDRAALYIRSLEPQNDFQSWVVEEVAALTLKIDRLGQVERRERDRLSMRAGQFWDDDRRSEAEALGARLASDPARVHARLRQTPQGCEWMRSRWALLAREADAHGAWDEVQTSLAHDLMGTPRGFRGQAPGERLDPEGRVEAGPIDLAAVARREIAALRDRITALADADAMDRASAEADLSDESSPELRRLHRYETDLNRRLRWCLDQLPKGSRSGQSRPSLKPHFAPTPRIEAPAGPAFEQAKPFETPPLPPAPDPILGEMPMLFFDPIPATISRPRRDPARLKAEARREAKSLKAEQRRHA